MANIALMKPLLKLRILAEQLTGRAVNRSGRFWISRAADFGQYPSYEFLTVGVVNPKSDRHGCIVVRSHHNSTHPNS